MKAAALLALLAALPGRAAETVTPAQARANVVSALPADIARGAGGGDLRSYLERLPPEKKKAALRALAEKEGELGDDPATLGVIGQAYAGLGKVKEARQAAERALSQNPDDPDARRLLGWVRTHEKLQGRDMAPASFGDAGGPGSGGQSAAAGPGAPTDVERRVQGVFRRGQRSAEFRDTMEDARGMSVAELDAAGISFKRAEADQRDAVMITQKGDRFTISIRDDALSTRGDSEARAAAQVANGVRQAQTLRDHEVVGWALIKARGWISGARTHKELAPGDIDLNPVSPSDQNLMAARKLLDQKTSPYVEASESYGPDKENAAFKALNSLVNVFSVEQLAARFMGMTGRGDEH